MELGLREEETVNTAFCGNESDEAPQLVVHTGNPNTEAPEEAAERDLLYSLNDRPPWYLCILLGFQHYIVAFGSNIAIPLILAEPFCIKDNNVAKNQIISTMFFVSGICTLLQTVFGVR
ncbi:solute carrier family 23 member 1-like isoform X2 [Thalassophryne amazonica]|nr:solute carrier family 23 member 1-like isoform X2 [Thalassophryne amazonica]